MVYALMHCLADQPPRAPPFARHPGRRSVPVFGSNVGDLLAETRDVSGELVEDGADVAFVVPEPTCPEFIEHRLQYRLVFGADAVQPDRIGGINVAQVTDISVTDQTCGSGR